MLKKISDAIHQFIGEWAFFIGSVMADGFDSRMKDIEAEEEAEMLRLENKEEGRKAN